MSATAGGIEDVLVVGGGDVGLLTGLCIRQLNPGLDVSVVDDFEEDPPDVGKSTYEEITTILHTFLDIPEERFVREVSPIWKGSVYFRDWCGYEPFHYPFDDLRKYPKPNVPRSGERYYYHYDELYADPERRTINEAMAELGMSPVYFEPSRGKYGRYNSVAYHFDTSRFNSFLRTLCEERAIALTDDAITAVDTHGEHVERVRSTTRAYEADLYVDASGFNRVIKGELDDSFRNFELPLDAAVNANVDRALSDAVPATVIDTGSYGWFWQIDTYDYRDLGYVYASRFVSEESAVSEFVDHCGGSVSVDDVAIYEFTSGYYETPWQGNCITIGNAEGFVEPLQSTGLTANAQAAVKLSNLLSSQGGVNHGGARDAYNLWVRRCWESIYDFVSVHYLYSAGDTQFWETMRSIPVSPRVSILVDHFDRNGYDTDIDPVESDDSTSNLAVFPPSSFYTIMRNMGAESVFYEKNPVRVSDDVRTEMDSMYESMGEETEQFLTIEEVYKGTLPFSNS